MLKMSSIRVTRELRLISNDSVVVSYNSNDVEFNVYESEINDKASVDTGAFIPGVFRVNPYSHSRSSLTCGGSGTIETKQIFTPYYYYYKHSGPLALLLNFTPPSLDGAQWTSLRNEALQKAFAKLGSSMFDGGVELGELKETLQMLRSPFKQLRNFFLKDGMKNLKLLNEVIRLRRRPKKIIQATGLTVFGTWLELRYGLRPLVKSIQDLAGMANKQLSRIDPDRIKTVRSKLKHTSFITGNSIGGSSATLLTNGKYNGTSNVTVRGIVYYKQSANLSAARRWGVGVANLPEIAWELTRLSFVVDWFLTIGPWISSFRVNPDFEILGSTTSTKVETRVANTILSVSGGQVGPTVIRKDFGSPAIYESNSFNRFVETSRPSLPQFRGLTGLDLPRTVDGLALILQNVLHKMR